MRHVGQNKGDITVKETMVSIRMALTIKDIRQLLKLAFEVLLKYVRSKLVILSPKKVMAPWSLTLIMKIEVAWQVSSSPRRQWNIIR